MVDSRTLSSFLPLTLLLACGPVASGPEEAEAGGDGDGDGDEESTGDGDGEPTGDGDGEPTGDGDGDGDGDRDLGDAMLRLLHLGVDAPALDVYLDGRSDPLVVGLEFQAGTAYLGIPAGNFTITATLAGEPDSTVLVAEPFYFADGYKYSAVVHGYQAELGAITMFDDDSGIDPGEARLQVSHVAPELGPIETSLVPNLDYGETSSITIPAGPEPFNINIDNDPQFELHFEISQLLGGVLVDLYVVNESGGSPVFLLAHHASGNTTRFDVDVCGNGVQQGLEVCDGADLGGYDCGLFGYNTGTLGCLPDCSGYDFSMCKYTLYTCSGGVVAIPDGGGVDPIGIPIDVPDMPGTVANVEVHMEVEHTWLADLDVALDKDQMASSWLFRDIQDAETNLECSGDYMLVTLDDAEPLSIQTDACTPDAMEPVFGHFAPQEPLSTFAGMNVAGTWTLWVDDDTLGESGSVIEWCLDITWE